MKAAQGKRFTDADRLVLFQSGYQTEAEARADGERWFDALLVAGIRTRVGFDLGRFRLSGGLTEAGKRHFEGELGHPVRDDFHGLDVFEENGTRFVEISAEASASRPLPPLLEALRSARHTRPLAPRLRLASELFGLSRFASAPRTHFLTLISAVEAVAEPASLGSEVTGVVEGWIQDLPASLKTDESFKGRLRELKRESIGRACKRLIEEHLGSDAAATFKKLYSTRSTLLHMGAVEGTDFVGEAAASEELTTALLEKMFEPEATAP